MSSRIARRSVLLGVAASAVTLNFPSKRGHTAELVTHEVKIRSFEFEPKKIIVKVGDTIRWTNEDIAPHTATADEVSWDTGEIGNGDSRMIEVTEGMELAYFCAFHPHMKGLIELA